GSPVPPPTTSSGTGGVTRITTGSALLHGTVNPGGRSDVSYWFVYGTSPSQLGHFTRLRSVRSSTTAVPVSSGVSGLRAHTKYYYRLEVTFGQHLSSAALRRFTTRAPAPSPTTRSAR